MKKENAITLVALIITIIVLLILATVSINLVMNGGVLDKAKSSVDKYSEEEIKEKIRLAYLEIKKKKIYNTNLDEEEFLKTRLEDKFGEGNANVKKINKTFKIRINNKKYCISKEGKVEEDNSILPDEYQQVEYIESTGTQYIFIGKVGISNVTAEIQYPNYPTVGSVNGGMDGSGNKGRLSIGIDRGSLTYFFGFGDKAVGSQVSGDSKKHTYNLNISNDNNKIAELFVDNIFIYSQTANNLSNPLYFTLFAYTGWGQITPNQFASCRIYNFLLEGQMELYPCYRKSDNEIGMYDIVEGRFYTNQGTGEFIAGPEV